MITDRYNLNLHFLYGASTMSEVEELENRIYNLPREEFAKFRDWFLQLENELWDKQIKSDFQAGKFNHLIEKAREEFAQGKAREL